MAIFVNIAAFALHFALFCDVGALFAKVQQHQQRSNGSNAGSTMGLRDKPATLYNHTGDETVPNSYIVMDVGEDPTDVGEDPNEMDGGLDTPQVEEAQVDSASPNDKKKKKKKQKKNQQKEKEVQEDDQSYVDVQGNVHLDPAPPQEEPAHCLPGQSRVQVQGQGTIEMKSLRVGDMVQVSYAGGLAYQPVMTFLHQVSGESEFVMIVHSLGNSPLRASPNHLVFVVSAEGAEIGAVPASSLKVGDWILAITAGGFSPSRVTNVGRGQAESMFAPLTSVGNIIVDDVLVSNYATVPSMEWISHSLAHAWAFPLRAYHQVGLVKLFQPLWASLCSQETSSEKLHRRWYCDGREVIDDAKTDDMHPFAKVSLKFVSLVKTLM